LCEVALMEVHAQGLNPRDNLKELTELVGLRKHLEEAEVAHVAEAR
jgi:hypothetical protein